MFLLDGFGVFFCCDRVLDFFWGMFPKRAGRCGSALFSMFSS